ncbi:probable protein SYM1 [Coccomyxa sp. Obi]|nr:probable protein SYM1 [Coccomyxa sp. Obi]
MQSERNSGIERLSLVLGIFITVSCLYILRHEVKTLVIGLWNSYLQSLKARPLLTKCCTSLCGFALGDTTAQRLLGNKRQDYCRTGRFMLYGFVIHAPGCHYFYQLLDRSVMPHDPTAPPAILVKIFLDRVAFTPLNMSALFIFTGLLEGLSWQRILYTMSRRMLPLWLLSNVLWPAAHVINFRYVPGEQRVLFVNVVSLLWNVVTCQVVGQEGTVHHRVTHGLKGVAQFHFGKKSLAGGV